MTADTISKTDLLIIPLNKNITDGITESAMARNTLFFLKHTIHIKQYNKTKTVFMIKYTANASSLRQPKQVAGILNIIKPKHPNLPICSSDSIVLFFHLFSNPSLHFTAKIMFGIIITAIKHKPNTLNHFILNPFQIAVCIDAVEINRRDNPCGCPPLKTDRGKPCPYD
ncbi:MAG: hypothetical protein ACI4RF_04210 [Eubacterium sp.]